ncbi:glycoside hydrolase family 43 protein [Algoriphagus halophytocola]|uniref:Glycoside hydrolase family 43 protein n=1 Tax=Algoriphagus halophytocola TaxID=2991499 RepID=A0ABY6MG55_9BACT|nr:MULTISPECIES: glycoside hydrolase family 43 protein [unclassified Algoriphagus]UZD21412.1 glycoside hydrolase family 43 protein [Algoriphagus sp. TR-M5]WBL42625.1 glycoside hydrolase family 43 protein [Algoriphagus sp. TR-M9]
MLYTKLLLSFFWLSLALLSPVKKGPILLADPTIFYHDGTYYLYGTSGNDKNLGFEVYVSKNLKSWKRSVKNDGYALKKGESYGDIGFWAPQVFEYEGKFYMAYTANEHIAIATSDSPLGPFTQTVKKDLEAPVKQIDPYIFIDDDGKKYMYHVRLTEGNRLYVAEMEDDFSGIKEETLTYCFHAEEPWENTQNVDWTVSEGPAIIKHEGLYYFIYSANDFRNPDYSVGYAVSKSPMGPWRKSPTNPIFDKAEAGINGSGHGDYFIDAKGKMKYVLHTHNSDEGVSPRKSALIELEFVKNGNEPDLLEVKKGSFKFLEVE